jgi:hypothetical protein
VVTETAIPHIVVPERYSSILNFGLNEESLDFSLIACKKKDFRMIEIFHLQMLDSMNQVFEKGNHANYSEEVKQLEKDIVMVRLNSDCKKMKLKFTYDLSKAIYFDDT